MAEIFDWILVYPSWEYQPPSTDVYETVELIFEDAYDLDSGIRIESDGLYEVIRGRNSINNSKVVLRKPTLEEEAEYVKIAPVKFFLVDISYGTSRLSETDYTPDSLTRTYFFADDGIAVERIGEGQNRMLEEGEQLDIDNIINDSNFMNQE